MIAIYNNRASSISPYIINTYQLCVIKIVALHLLLIHIVLPLIFVYQQEYIVELCRICNVTTYILNSKFIDYFRRYRGEYSYNSVFLIQISILLPRVM